MKIQLKCYRERRSLSNFRRNELFEESKDFAFESIVIYKFFLKKMLCLQLQNNDLSFNNDKTDPMH